MTTKTCPRCSKAAPPMLYMFAPGWQCEDVQCSAAWGPAVWLATIIGFWEPGFLVFAAPPSVSYWRALRIWWEASRVVPR